MRKAILKWLGLSKEDLWKIDNSKTFKAFKTYHQMNCAGMNLAVHLGIDKDCGKIHDELSNEECQELGIQPDDELAWFLAHYKAHIINRQYEQHKSEK